MAEPKDQPKILGSLRGKFSSPRHIVYVVLEDKAAAEAFCDRFAESPGIVRVERSIYEPGSYQAWDTTLVNDRYMLTVTGQPGIYHEIIEKLKEVATHRIEYSTFKDKEIVTVVGDLPDQATARAMLKGYDYECSTFNASSRTKTYKLGSKS